MHHPVAMLTLRRECWAERKTGSTWEGFGLKRTARAESLRREKDAFVLLGKRMKGNWLQASAFYRALDFRLQLLPKPPKPGHNTLKS